VLIFFLDYSKSASVLVHDQHRCHFADLVVRWKECLRLDTSA